MHNMTNEIPPGIEKKKECLVVEQQGKGFTLVDENKNNYLWQDEHGQVLWTKDRNVLDAAKKEIEAKLNTPTPEEKAKTLTPEDVKKIEEDLALSEKEDKEDEKIATEKKLEKEKIQGVTPATTSTGSTPASTPGNTVPVSDEEKLRQQQAQILKDIHNKYKSEKERKDRKAQDFLHEARMDQNQKIEDTRKEYIDQYGNSVRDVNGLKKFGYKIRNFLGISRKDAFTDGSEKNNYEYEKNKTVTDRFTDKRVSEREEKLKQKNWTEDDIVILKKRYKKVLRKSGSEDFSINKDFDFVKNENALLRGKKSEAWEKNKSEQEKKAEEVMIKAREWYNRHPNIKKTLGNKWFRFAVMTGTIGLATGGMSTFFLANRAARFMGGLTGGAIGKAIGELTLNEDKMKEISDKKLANLDASYKGGYISASEYDTKKENIDLLMTRYARLKQGLVIGLAGGVGALAGSAESALAGDHTHDIPTKTPEHRDQTTPVNGPEKTTPVNQTPGTPPQPAPIQESPTPTETQTPPTTPTQTAPETAPATETTPTRIPDEHTIVKAGSGKGIEHAFRAQIEHDPELAEKLKELYHYKGGISTPEELHKFSGVVAHQIALGEGYVGSNGAERWISGTASYDIDIEPNGEVVIHERSLDAQGNWSEAQNSTGTLETDVDKDASGRIYEQTHKGGDAHHVEHLRKSINESYHRPRETMSQITPEKYPVADLPTNINTLPKAELPQTSLPHAELPPSSIQQPPTIPTRPMQSYPVMPRTYNPSIMNPGPANPMSNIFSAAETAPSSGKSFLDILFEGFFGPEKPSMPTPLETPQNGGEGIA